MLPLIKVAKVSRLPVVESGDSESGIDSTSEYSRVAKRMTEGEDELDLLAACSDRSDPFFESHDVVVGPKSKEAVWRTEHYCWKHVGCGVWEGEASLLAFHDEIPTNLMESTLESYDLRCRTFAYSCDHLVVLSTIRDMSCVSTRICRAIGDYDSPCWLQTDPEEPLRRQNCVVELCPVDHGWFGEKEFEVFKGLKGRWFAIQKNLLKVQSPQQAAPKATRASLMLSLALILLQLRTVDSTSMNFRHFERFSSSCKDLVLANNCSEHVTTVELNGACWKENGEWAKGVRGGLKLIPDGSQEKIFCINRRCSVSLGCLRGHLCGGDQTFCNSYQCSDSPEYFCGKGYLKEVWYSASFPYPELKPVSCGEEQEARPVLMDIKDLRADPMCLLRLTDSGNDVVLTRNSVQKNATLTLASGGWTSILPVTKESHRFPLSLVCRRNFNYRATYLSDVCLSSIGGVCPSREANEFVECDQVFDGWDSIMMHRGGWSCTTDWGKVWIVISFTAAILLALSALSFLIRKLTTIFQGFQSCLSFASRVGCCVLSPFLRMSKRKSDVDETTKAAIKVCCFVILMSLALPVRACDRTIVQEAKAEECIRKQGQETCTFVTLDTLSFKAAGETACLNLVRANKTIAHVSLELEEIILHVNLVNSHYTGLYDLRIMTWTDPSYLQSRCEFGKCGYTSSFFRERIPAEWRDFPRKEDCNVISANPTCIICPNVCQAIAAVILPMTDHFWAIQNPDTLLYLPSVKMTVKTVDSPDKIFNIKAADRELGEKIVMNYKSVSTFELPIFQGQLLSPLKNDDFLFCPLTSEKAVQQLECSDTKGRECIFDWSDFKDLRSSDLSHYEWKKSPLSGSSGCSKFPLDRGGLTWTATSGVMRAHSKGETSVEVSLSLPDGLSVKHMLDSVVPQLAQARISGCYSCPSGAVLELLGSSLDMTGFAFLLVKSTNCTCSQTSVKLTTINQWIPVKLSCSTPVVVGQVVLTGTNNEKASVSFAGVLESYSERVPQGSTDEAKQEPADKSQSCDWWNLLCYYKSTTSVIRTILKILMIGAAVALFVLVIIGVWMLISRVKLLIDNSRFSIRKIEPTSGKSTLVDIPLEPSGEEIEEASRIRSRPSRKRNSDYSFLLLDLQKK